MIVSIANKLIERFNTRDPYELAECLEINVFNNEEFEFEHGQYKLKKTPGIYITDETSKFAIINADLSKQLQKVVLSHELGHDQLHCLLRTVAEFLENNYNNNSCRQEYEANIFAATILLPDDEVLEDIVVYGYDANQLASKYNVDVGLMSLKLEAMITCGYKLRPVPTNHNFLKSKEYQINN